MLSKRKFYRTVITAEVLSEEPFEFETLEDVHHAIIYGDCSGTYSVTVQETVDGTRMAALLLSQRSDPDFFQLTEAGEDMDEEDEDNKDEHEG
jgi:hypothetical protein